MSEDNASHAQSAHDARLAASPQKYETPTTTRTKIFASLVETSPVK